MTPPFTELGKLISACVVVNLDSRNDRWQTLQTEVAAAGLPGVFERLSAVRGTDLPGYGIAPWFRGGKRDRNWAGRAGCALSHRRVIERARDAGWSSVLILEDDADFQANFSVLAEKLATFLNTRETPWSVCYLGFTGPEGPSRQLAALDESHAVHQLYGCYTTHAYLLHRNTFDGLLEQLPTVDSVWPWIARHRSIDRWYARNLSQRFETLVVAPSIISQKPGESDITGRAARADELDAFHVPLPPVTLGDAAFQSLVRRHARVANLRTFGNRFRFLVKKWRGF